ncbi:MAG: DNA-processing protein DprA [Clostridia bacterium]
MSTEPRQSGLLTLARMPFLSAREKILLADLLDGSVDVSVLCIGALQEITGRSLRGAVWEPQAWKAMAAMDAAFLKSSGTRALSYFDEGYPGILRETARPPFMLYCRGRLPESGTPALAIVGTRYPTGNGLKISAGFAREAAAAGIPVVSGLARGIDAAAHRGALLGSGPTFAVLGCGIDTVYPRANKELAMRMISGGGGLISEYPPGVTPSRWTFPERNRILAGLCRSTVVVEAPTGSGALITASFALEEGRDVYVAEACRGGLRSAGSDALASDGAPAVEDLQEILSDWYGWSGPGMAFASGIESGGSVSRHHVL